MAMFYKNICQFNQCNLEFANVYDLIQHIEETHIRQEGEKKLDTQSQVACAPLSLICRYFQRLPDQPARPIIPKPTFQQPSPSLSSSGVGGGQSAAALKKRMPSIIAQQQSSGMSPAGAPGAGQQSLPQQTSSPVFHAPTNVIAPRSSGATPASHASEDDERMSVGRESYSSESSMAVEENAGEPGALYKIISTAGGEDRRYVCTVAGCKKSYKNMNGIRYHIKITHMQAGSAAGGVAITPADGKKFKCQCGKAYKTSHGLHNHMLQQHHRQAPPISASTPVAAAAAANVTSGNVVVGGGVTTSTKFSTAVTGVSVSSSPAGQYKRGLALSMLGGGGGQSGASVSSSPALVKHIPQQPTQMSQQTQSLASSYYAQQQQQHSSAAAVKAAGAGGSSTTTLPSGVSVQVSNLGGGAPTTVQVGQQGALGVVASTTTVVGGGGGLPTGAGGGLGLHVSAGRRLHHHHPQQHLQQQPHHPHHHLHSIGGGGGGGRSLKIQSMAVAAASAPAGVVATSAPPLATMGPGGGGGGGYNIANASVTTMGGSSGVTVRGTGGGNQSRGIPRDWEGIVQGSPPNPSQEMT